LPCAGVAEAVDKTAAADSSRIAIADAPARFRNIEDVLPFNPRIHYTALGDRDSLH
jgi:hypothetical protein